MGNRNTVPVAAFVPIRLGSKRVKNKSVLPIAGRPMFCWCLESLDELEIPVYVYTNDIEVLKSMLDFDTKNITFLPRSVDLDEDNTRGIEIYRSFAKDVPAEVYLLAHCTSPFLKKTTYEKILSAVTKGGYDSSCTVERKQTFSWFDDIPLNFSIPRKQTQLIEPVFIETSAAYCYRADVLATSSRSGKRHKLCETTPLESVDIDTPQDVEMLEFLINRLGRRTDEN